MKLADAFERSVVRAQQALIESRWLAVWACVFAILHSAIITILFLPSLGVNLSMPQRLVLVQLAMVAAVVAFFSCSLWKSSHLERRQIAAFFCIIVFWFVLLWRLRVTGWDDYSYRLTAMGFYFQRGKFALENTGMWWFNIYPKGGESWLIAERLAFREEGFLNIFHIGFLGLICGASFVCLQAFTDGPQRYWKVAVNAGASIIAIFALPVAILPIATVYNDSLMAFFCLAALLFLMRASRSDEIELGELGCSGAFMLAATTIKLSAWNFGLWWAVCVAAMFIVRRRVRLPNWPTSLGTLGIAGSALVYLLYNKTIFGSWLPQLPQVPALEMQGSGLRLILSTMGIFHPAVDYDWAHFYGHFDLSHANHWFKLILVYLELEPWNGLRYFYDARFSGWGAWAFPLLVGIAAWTTQRPALRMPWIVSLLFLLVCPLKYYPRYPVLIWSMNVFALVIFSSVGITNFRTLSRPARIYVVFIFAGVMFTWLNVQKTLSGSFRELAHGEKLVGYSRSQIQTFLRTHRDEQICVDKSVYFPFDFFRSDFSNFVIIEDATSLASCRIAVYSTPGQVPAGFDVIIDHPFESMVLSQRKFACDKAPVDASPR